MALPAALFLSKASRAVRLLRLGLGKIACDWQLIANCSMEGALQPAGVEDALPPAVVQPVEVIEIKSEEPKPLLGFLTTSGARHALKLRHRFEVNDRYRLDIGCDLDSKDLSRSRPWAGVTFQARPVFCTSGRGWAAGAPLDGAGLGWGVAGGRVGSAGCSKLAAGFAQRQPPRSRDDRPKKALLRGWLERGCLDSFWQPFLDRPARWRRLLPPAASNTSASTRLSFT